MVGESQFLFTSSEQLRFGMLKAWMMNPDLSSIDVEEKYHTYVEELRTDRYVTVSWLLEAVTVRSTRCFFWIGQWFLSHSFPIKHSKSPHGLLVIPGDDPAVGKTLRKEQGRKRIHQRIDEGSLVVRKNGYHECFPFPLLMHSLHSPNSRSGQKGVAHPQALDFRFCLLSRFSVNHLTGPVLREGANV